MFLRAGPRQRFLLPSPSDAPNRSAYGLKLSDHLMVSERTGATLGAGVGETSRSPRKVRPEAPQPRCQEPDFTFLPKPSRLAFDL